jgi:hypothetical protein
VIAVLLIPVAFYVVNKLVSWKKSGQATGPGEDGHA